MNNFNLKCKNSILFVAFFAFMFAFTGTAEAGFIDILRDKILNRTNAIKKLNEEITEFRNNANEAKEEVQSLEGELTKLEGRERTLNSNIRVTDNKITRTSKNIRSLTIDIDNKRNQISDSEEDLSETLRILNELESRSLVEIILSKNGFSHFWDNVENIGRFQASVHTSLKDLEKLEASLSVQKKKQEKEKKNLIAYESNLSDQKRIVVLNQREKDRLLKETKNKESEYQKLLATRLEQKELLEKEIANFESQLRIEIDPNSLPAARAGVLDWPLDSIYITQYFGNTPFATKNSQVYNGGGHNGVDFRASVGSAVYASSNGIVVGVADTDTQCYKVSYGKWVLIEHFNGLSTLYAHLSLQKVSVGQEVKRGDIIGRSGSTGYSTGPHLHFAVFATKAVSISGQGGTRKYISRVCGVELTLPVSAKNGYLNPLSYLPN